MFIYASYSFATYLSKEKTQHGGNLRKTLEPQCHDTNMRPGILGTTLTPQEPVESFRLYPATFVTLS